ncbi:MAG: PAS domain-containing protein, partial [Desulfobacteraceae bacterium]|nr:PAS domain-containing protein [Desulfobacteraceae bacterium]
MRWKIAFCISFCFIIIVFNCTSVLSSALSSQDIKQGVKPKVHNGTIDLADWDFLKDGSVKLSGEWAFYWNQLLSPIDFKSNKVIKRTGYFNVPGSWNYYRKKEKSFAGTAYATYRLKIKLKEARAYAIRILPISTAYKIWINGESLSVGKVGKSKQDMIPQFSVKTIRFFPENPETEVVLQVSNFYHRSGGPWRSIEVGLFDQMSDQKIKSFGFDLFLISSILIMGIYHLILFVLRRKDITNLYFGALCIAAVVRTLVTSEHVFYFLFPNFSWLMAYKFEYLSFYLGIPMAVMFVNSLYPDEALGKTSKLIFGIAVFFSLIVVFTQPQVFSHTVIVYEIITVIFLYYISFIIIKAFLNKQPGALFVAIGSLFTVITMINDILFANELVNTFYMAPIGILVFILCHSFNLSIKFSNTLTNIEIIEEKYRSVFENSLDGIFQISLLDQTFIANPALANMLGYNSPEDLPEIDNKGWRQVFVDTSVYDQFLVELEVN